MVKGMHLAVGVQKEGDILMEKVFEDVLARKWDPATQNLISNSV